MSQAQAFRFYSPRRGIRLADPVAESFRAVALVLNGKPGLLPTLRVLANTSARKNSRETAWEVRA